MANVETRRNSYEAGSTYEHILYEEQRDNWSILSRSGRAIAHDEDRPPRHLNGWKISENRAIVNHPFWKGLGMQWSVVGNVAAGVWTIPGARAMASSRGILNIQSLNAIP